MDFSQSSTSGDGHRDKKNTMFRLQDFKLVNDNVFLKILEHGLNLSLHNTNHVTSKSVDQLRPPPISSATTEAIGNQTQIVNKGIVTKLSDSKKDNDQLLRNIQILDFKNPDAAYTGSIKIINQNAFPVIVSQNQVNIMAASNYGNGRAVIFGDQNLLKKQFLQKDKNWVFLLRNIMKWITKNRQNSKKNPLKILMLGLQISQLTKSLARASIYAQFVYASQLSEVKINQFHAICLGDLSFKSLSTKNCQEISQFVKNGGGVLSVFRYWTWKNYGEGKQCKDPIKECLHNQIFKPMGMENDQNFAEIQQLKFNPQEIMELYDNSRKYIRNMNPQFVSIKAEEQNGNFANDREKIFNGVQNIDFGEACFSSFHYPYQSFFPVVSVNKQAAVIAGHYGNGKIVAFGHSALFTEDKADNRKFVENILAWSCNQKKSYNIGFLFNTQDWNNIPLLSGLPQKTQIITDPNQIQSQDVICFCYYPDMPSELNENMLNQLKNYVKNGGSLIAATHGWVWSNYGAGKDGNLKYQQSFAGYLILKQFDIYLQQDFFEIGTPFQIQSLPPIQQKNPQLQQFLRNDLLKVLRGSAKFTASDSQISSYVQKVSNSKNLSKICEIDLYHQLVDAFIESAFNIQKNYNTIKMNNKFYNNVYQLMNALSYACPPQECRALPPSLNKYPGYADNKIDKKVVQVYKNLNKRCYIGLYVNPGQPIKIQHENQIGQTTGVKLVINSNLSLIGYDNGNLCRFPNISAKFDIKAREFLVASPHGGTLFFEIQSKQDTNKPLVFEIYGAYDAPYFNEAIHSQKDFDQIKKINAPFFVFETKSFILQGPTKQSFGGVNINVSELCKYWNTVIKLYKQFRGIQRFPFDKDAVFNDINTILGYMHSGNPIMTGEDVTFEFLSYGKNIIKDGNWGIYHELGHNHQDYKWTTNGTGEVTNNIYSLYLFYKMHGVPVFKNSWLMTNLAQLTNNIKKHFALPQNEKLANYSADPQLGLYMYAVLIDQFGFEIFSALHKTYDKIDASLNTDQQKYEMLVEQLSLVIKQNLWSYFKNWGMPVTQVSKAKISKLKKYACQKHPNFTA